MALSSSLAAEHAPPNEPISWSGVVSPRPVVDSVAIRVGIRTGFILDDIPGDTEFSSDCNVFCFSSLNRIDDISLDELSGLYFVNEATWQYCMDDDIMNTYLNDIMHMTSLDFIRVVSSEGRIVAGEVAFNGKELFGIFSPYRSEGRIRSQMYHRPEMFHWDDLSSPVAITGIPFLNYYTIYP